MISIVETLCLLDEISKGEDEAEEPDSSTKKEAGFYWAWILIEEGGSPALEEDELQGLLVQALSFLHSAPCPWSHSGYLMSSFLLF